MKELRGRVAAITGAGSGIGRALAVDLARRGTHLALTDIDTDGLAATVAECEGYGVKVTSQRLDVADRDAIYEWAATVPAEHGHVNLLFNNAGVALVADIATMSDEDLHWLVDINLWGVVNGCRAFLPHLEDSGEGHIVNLSSVFGLLSIPSQSAYNISKFAVRGFSDALRMELEIARSCVSVTTVHPGGVKTNIARRARQDPATAAPVKPGQDLGEAFDRIARTTPEAAAEQILAGVERNRRRVLVGADGTFLDLVSRLPAGLSQRVLVQGARLDRRRNRR
ncbi:SDR family NAD(P)-dependent oxidoreductase [Dermatobacter hominis]|uniref:SDR family NAD(P)-dependent oxidoreductase n=1 Tax=Dermatobacter hominis TaxID=2884263 RepID=UPI001D1136DE|nr:SDR family NAD(P)-dependent oxidoreductase [Dermatobacter hominis]UDY35277.1 SDR family NAD(P)-dependent oxidoreductase [Dermatobacter hominis]